MGLARGQGAVLDRSRVLHGHTGWGLAGLGSSGLQGSQLQGRSRSASASWGRGLAVVGQGWALAAQAAPHSGVQDSGV